MVHSARPTPDTMVDSETGRTLVRDVRPFTVTYKGWSETVDLPGYYPEGPGDGVHIGPDLRAAGDALRRIKIRLGEIEPDGDMSSRRPAAE